MTLGIVARCDDRGLGVMTRAAVENLNPDKVLVIAMNFGPWEQHTDWYAHLGARCSIYRMDADLKIARWVQEDWLDGLDVVYMAETPYDWTFIETARRMGVRTVMHSMPELVDRRKRGEPQPDEWWWPTDWMTEHALLPKGPVVPVPFESPPRRNGWPAAMRMAPESDGHPLRVLHVCAAAMEDRNGTKIFLESLNHVTEPIEVTVVDQGARHSSMVVDHPAWDARGIDLFYRDAIEDRWSIYDAQHVLVQTRRYGGLSLTCQEAASVGLALITTERWPELKWPGLKVRVDNVGKILVKFGQIATQNADPVGLAECIDMLALNRKALASHQAESLEWAEANSWDALRPEYERRLRENP